MSNWSKPYLKLTCPIGSHHLRKSKSSPLSRPGCSRADEFDPIETRDILDRRPGLLERAQDTKFTYQGEPVTETEIKLMKNKQKLAEHVVEKKMTNWQNVLNNNQISEMSMITEHLALTSAGGLFDENFQAFGGKGKLKYIFNVSNEVPMLKINGVKSYRIPVEDATTCTCEQMEPYFDEVTDKIDEAIKERKAVLVHCWRGISRSATIIMAYLIKHKEKSFEEAFKMVKDKRGVVRPAVIYLQQLADFETRVRHQEVTRWGNASHGDMEHKLPDFILNNSQYFATYKNAFEKFTKNK